MWLKLMYLKSTWNPLSKYIIFDDYANGYRHPTKDVFEIKYDIKLFLKKTFFILQCFKSYRKVAKVAVFIHLVSSFVNIFH